ncbi:MAG: MmgE/PrpD family protein [Paracoccaceae bacterium]
MNLAASADTAAAPAAARLGAFIASASRVHGPLALERARTAFLDTIGCMLLGAPSAPARIARRAMTGWGQGNAVLAGTGRIAPAPWAALANGTAAHAYDLDDHEDPGVTHPSAVLVPALLALAAERDPGGAELLDAYIVGLEAIMRLGEAVNFSHYNLGWHSTRTLGAIGAAAAAARLMRLDAVQAAHAVSLATSTGGGFTSQFGTTAKPLHAGLAAQGGMVAAAMAGAGATSGPGALDGPVSLASLMVAPGEARFGALERLGAPWGIEEHGLNIKIHACCSYTHRAIDGVLRLKAQDRIEPDDIAAIRVSLVEPHRAILPFDAAQTPAEALFSVPHTVALALIRGAVTPADFTGVALADPAIRALATRVTVETRTPRCPEINIDPDDPDPVEIALAGGATLATSVAVPKGTPGDPLTADEVLAKFHRCAAASVDAAQATAIADTCARLDRLAEVRELTALLATR